MKNSAILKQAIGNRDTKHGLLDLPVTLEKKMKKPKMRFAEGGLAEDPLRKKSAGEVIKNWWNKKPAEKEAPKAAPAPPKKMITDVIRERAEQPGVGVEDKKFRKGGTVRCRDGCAIRGKTKGAMR